MVNDDILYTDFFNYSLVIDNGEEVFLFDQNQQIKELPDTSVGLIMGDGFALPDGYVALPPESGPTTGNSLPLAHINRALLMKDFDSTNANCGPTALANIIKLYAENILCTQSAPLGSLKLNNSDMDTYNELARLSEYNGDGEGVKPPKLKQALTKYIYNQNYSTLLGLYDNYNRTWDSFNNSISSKQPILLHVEYKNSKGEDESHTQVVIGTFKYSDDARYLSIYSGYYRYPIYISCDSNSFDDMYGVPVSIF